MKKVAILLSTYNGEKYLKNQLDSLMTQSYKDFEIIARDDGSSDDTVEILKSFSIKLLKSEQNLGAKGSFGELLKYAVQNGDSEYFMFCDQDDVWKEDKIEKTLAKMQDMENTYSDMPLLVHTDLEVVDEKLNTINSSFYAFQKINPFEDNLNKFLVQNSITGCTIMINRELAQKCLPIPSKAIIHDWWIGLVDSKFGKIGYLNSPTIQYRQHNNNTVGAKGFSIHVIVKKIYMLFTSDIVKQYQSQAQAFLEQYQSELDIETIKMLEDFTTLEQKSWWQKRAVLLKYKLLKQGFIRNCGLFLKI